MSVLDHPRGSLVRALVVANFIIIVVIVVIVIIVVIIVVVTWSTAFTGVGSNGGPALSVVPLAATNGSTFVLAEALVLARLLTVEAIVVIVVIVIIVSRRRWGRRSGRRWGRRWRRWGRRSGR
jgi:hypothetical protein